VTADGRSAPRAAGSVENLHGFMLATAQSAPDRAAVVELDEAGGLRTVSYGQLHQQVEGYVAELAELGLDVGDRVLIESNTSANSVAMLLACSSLGLAFIPVSPETPALRLRSIIDSAEPALHLQPDAGKRTDLGEALGTARFGTAGLTVERARLARTRHRTQVLGSDTAYIIFTSGTTGRPKGVVMSQRSVITFFSAIVRQGLLRAEDRVASTSALQFDFALFDIGLTLGSGATLVPVPREQLSWPRRFLGLLREAEVSWVDGVPSIWRPVLRHEPEMLASLTRLRGTLFAGEEFPLPELRDFQRLLPQARVINGYGATESMACSFTEVPNPLPPGLERLSIGHAHEGAEMILLDESGAPIDESGIEGEIYLRSPSLFSGYWDDPDNTRSALVVDPLEPRSGLLVLRTGDLAYRGEQGEMYLCGRVDSQVQIRGNRVELGEVERRLLEFPGVAAAVALVLPRPEGDPLLIAFLVMRSGHAFDKVGMRAFCTQTLPNYMVPADIREVEELPLTVNGKVDRKLLASRAAASASAPAG
jgi:amino acid adenylation domain-containing protein